MRLRFGTVFVAAMAVATAAEAENAREMWDIYTDFGLFEGGVRKTEKGFAADENGIRVETEVATGVAGVTRRRTVVRNLSEKPLVATCLLDAFRFEGGAFEVYTQANTWMNESRGAWQPLHVGVGARGGGMRTTFGAAPVLAIWNKETGRGRVFHLMSDAAWEMRASIVSPCRRSSPTTSRTRPTSTATSSTPGGTRTTPAARCRPSTTPGSAASTSWISTS